MTRDLGRALLLLALAWPVLVLWCVGRILGAGDGPRT